MVFNITDKLDKKEKCESVEFIYLEKLRSIGWLIDSFLSMTNINSKANLDIYKKLDYEKVEREQRNG